MTAFRTRIKRGERLLGTMVTLSSPAVAEILAGSGLDWLFIDEEHAPYSTADIQAILQAVGDRIPSAVRVSMPAELPIKKALDVGARGVIIPCVNTAEQAADMVRFARYAPEGNRGVGLARAHGYGPRFSDYLASANDEIAVVVQAEHIQAVDNIEAIVKVPGVDAVLVGPYDLSASLGKTGKLDDPAVVEAIDHVTATCQQANMTLGIFGVSPNAVLPYAKRGYSLLVVGVDTLMLSAAAGKIVTEMSP